MEREHRKQSILLSAGSPDIEGQHQRERTIGNCKCRDRMNLQEKWQLNLRLEEVTIGIIKKPKSVSPAGKTSFPVQSFARLERRGRTEKKPQWWWVAHVINKDFKCKEKKRKTSFFGMSLKQ